ncbi:hypothetical protein AK812_SmicGene22093 [Symbiodinium microadriaticum]|uniref:Uncharacterized protein n=1 Tax=Symbiodinium microadriaticum TaxID=2951 RepID=A0A1Q9DKQ4_SYMMI|nr:hypothetical protein AK812_SmicGene22093 [Symbiodinium microadriaticum]
MRMAAADERGAEAGYRILIITYASVYEKGSFAAKGQKSEKEEEKGYASRLAVVDLVLLRWIYRFQKLNYLRSNWGIVLLRPGEEEVGRANGYTNGYVNGMANGHANGHANGLANGMVNGYVNGHGSASQEDYDYLQSQRQPAALPEQRSSSVLTHVWEEFSGIAQGMDVC